MKKLLTLMMLLVTIVTGAWAQDPDIDFTFESSTIANYLKTYSIEGNNVVVGSSATSISSGNGGYYIDLGSTSSSFGANYINVKAPETAKIAKISVLATGSGNSKDIKAPVLGFDTAWDGSSTNADNIGYIEFTSAASNGGKYTTAAWYDLDVSSWDASEVRVYRSIKGITVTGTEIATSETVGNGQTLRVWGLKVWMKSSGPSISASSASITATESGVEVTKGITVKGTNLTGSTLTATLSPAVAGLSVSLDNDAISAGAISATATLSYTATENAEGTTKLILSDGTTSKEVTVTYKATVALVELQTTSAETVWDFSKLTINKSSANYNSSDDAIKLDGTTTPKNTDEIVYTNYDGTDFTVGSGFAGSYIAFTGQYPIRKNSFAQNGTLKIKTSVPGTLIVKFSDTGSSASSSAVKRYLVINGENTEYWTSRENNGSEPYAAQLNVTSGEIAVPAGDVTITGSSAIVVSYVKFTPAPAPTTETITIPEDGVLTYVTENDLDFSTIDGDITAYAVTAVSATSATTAVVAQVPAGTALLIKGTAGSYDIEIAESASAITNLLLASDGTITGGDNIYAYSKTAKKFKKVASTVTIPAGKAYLQANAGDAIDIDFAGEATAVEAIAEAAEAVAPVKVVTAKGIQIGKYNIAGQQVK